MTQLEMLHNIKEIVSTCAQVKHWKITAMNRKPPPLHLGWNYLAYLHVSVKYGGIG